jgi:hypothetical protein
MDIGPDPSRHGPSPRGCPLRRVGSVPARRGRHTTPCTGSRRNRTSLKWYRLGGAQTPAARRPPPTPPITAAQIDRAQASSEPHLGRVSRAAWAFVPAGGTRQPHSFERASPRPASQPMRSDRQVPRAFFMTKAMISNRTQAPIRIQLVMSRSFHTHLKTQTSFAQSPSRVPNPLSEGGKKRHGPYGTLRYIGSRITAG